MDIKEIRAQYPQYEDLSDAELVSGLHSKFYSDIPIDEFHKKVGFTPIPTKPTEEQGDFMRAVKNYLPGMQETYGGAKVLAGNVLGNKELIQSGVESMKAGQQKQVSKETDEFTKAWEKGIGTVLTDWLPYQIGSGAMSAAEILTSMGIGAGVGAVTGAGVGAIPGALSGALGKTLLKKGVKEAAETILEKQGKEAAENFIQSEAKKALVASGKTAGIASSSILHGAGEVTNRAVDELDRQGKTADQLDVARVLPAAALHAVADFVSDKITLGALKGMGESAKKGLIYEVTKQIGVTGAKELLPEEVQTMAERYGAKLSLADAEALKDYINTGAAAFGMSVVPGGVGGVRTHLASKLTDKVETDKENEDKKRESVNTENAIQEIQPPDSKVASVLKPKFDLETGEPIAQGGENVIQQTNAPAGGAGTEVLGGPTATAAAAGAGEAGLGRPGVASDQGIESAPQDGAGTQQPPLTATKYSAVPYVDPDTNEPTTLNFDEAYVEDGTIYIPGTVGFDYPLENFNLSERGPEAVALEKALQNKFAAELQEIKPIEEQAPADQEVTEEVAEEQAPVNQEVIDEQALADQEAKAAEAAAVEQARVEEEAAAPVEEAIPTAEEDLKTLKSLRNKLNRAIQAEKRAESAEESNAKKQKVKEAQDAYDAFVAESKPRREAAIARLTEKAPKEQKTAATQGRKTKAVKAAPITADYLNSETFYGGASPMAIVNERKADKDNKLDTDPVNVGIINAGHEIAFDAFDTVDIRGGVNPELKKIAEEKNKVQQAKRQQMRKELSGKKDPETGKEYSKKRITALVSNIPLYKAGAPLEFLSKKELADIYRKYVGKRKFVEEERTTREAQKQNRDKFVEGLNELQKIKLQLVEQRAFTEEVAANVLRKKQTTGADSRKDRVSKTAEELSKELQTIAKEDVQAREAQAQKVAEQEVAAEKDLEATAKEVSKAAEKALPKKEVKEKKAPTKSKLVTSIEKAIDENDADAALDAIATDKINESATRNVAKHFLTLVKSFGGIRIQFRELPVGEDGMFDPKTNTIALNGKDKVYTGKRPLHETVMHEVGHYLTDHVVDNRAKYLKSIANPDKRKEVEMALNRLDNNYRFVKSKLGKQFNIPTMKEFIAETFSNPKFQVAMANLEQFKGAENIEGFVGPRKQYKSALLNVIHSIASALGFSSPYEGVTLKETLEDLFKIVSLPTEKIRGKEVSYAKEKKEKKAPTLRESTFDNPGSEYDVEEALAPKNWRWFKERFFTRPGWRKIAYEFQNDRYYIKHWEDVLQLAGKIKHGVQEKFNNIYTQLTLATSLASNYYKTYVAGSVDRLDSSIMKYAQAAGISTNEAMKKLHVLIEALHEPERRLVKYLMNVPLRDAAADRRKEILELVRANNKLSKSEAAQLFNELKAIVNNPKNIDTASKKATDINDTDYNVLGINSVFAAESRKQYENSPHKELLDEILASVSELNDATAELNKIANYWSQPVTNIVNFYGWKYYAPFKGKQYTRHGIADELLDFDSAKNGKELQELAYSFEGRETPADNPLLQVLADASRAAARAGRKDLTQSILNAVTPDENGKQLLHGKVVHTLKFEDRDKAAEILKKDPNVKKENTIFHYKEDGSIDIIEINDRKLRESIRRTYTDSNPMVDIANTITSRLGQLHTRYNYNFAPMNFVRDALTNAWTIGADMGPVESAKFIKAISGSVAKGGLFKAMEIAHLLQKNDMKAIDRLAKTPGYEDMVDYIKHGGMVSYLQSLTTKSNFDEINKRLGKDKIAKTKDQLDAVVDTWTDMFEITSRAAAFGIAKRAAIDSNLKQGMSPAEAEAAANIRAAGYAKNLANFEQVGQYGKAMGAFYMFFRPSATGAVRAIEAVAPAFTSLRQAITNLPPHIQQPAEGDVESKRALEEFKANYAQKQQNARIMVSALMGMGALAYTMSAMMAPDDDLGRNKLMTDNMDQWTRFWRIHVPGMKQPIQIPWGFGLGSFAAAGAQLASVVSGQQPAGKALANVFLQVSLDSFVPIPVSRMPPADNPLAFAIDSIAPSTVRPVIEFLINKNGLGQDIYNSASGRRMGDAFLGGDKIPEMYKNAAAALWDATNGAIDISPNTMYFLSNSYADGPARVFEGAFGITDTLTGRKEYNPKTDLPLIGSFFGAEANVDSREFASVEKQIKEKANRVEASKLDANRYVRYMADNPFDEMLVDSYNKDIADLNKLRNESKKIRVNHDLSPKEKSELLRLYTFQENIIKRNLIEQYKAYGVTP